jgi:hypothetical protein
VAYQEKNFLEEYQKDCLHDSNKWQKEHEHGLMKNEEVIQIIQDVLSEIRERKNLKSFKSDS